MISSFNSDCLDGAVALGVDDSHLYLKAVMETIYNSVSMYAIMELECYCERVMVSADASS
jgi:hypothetical protein